MVDLYSKFIEALREYLIFHIQDYSLEYSTIDNQTIYTLSNKGIDNYFILNEEVLHKIINEFSDSLTSKSDNEVLIHLTASTIYHTPNIFKQLMTSYQQLNNDIENEAVLKLQFEHIFELFFVPVIEYKYSEFIESISEFYMKENNNSFSYYVFEKTINSLINKDKYHRFQNVGELYLISCLSSLEKMDFTESHYDSLEKFLQYHNFNEIKNERNHLNKISKFIKEKISSTQWKRLKYLTHNNLEKNDTLEPIFQESLETIYTLIIDTNSIKQHYEELCLGDDACKAVAYLKDLFEKHKEKFSLKKVLLDKDDSPQFTFRFITENENMPNKILINSVIEDYLQFYGESLRLGEDISEQGFSDIINFSVMNHKAKDIGIIKPKKKI